MRHRASNTFAKLPVLALINDLKKKFRKKLYVTIPQWSEAFRNMSHLRSGWNRAKCGLQLNDPIDWFKLRLNQPKNNTNGKTSTLWKWEKPAKVVFVRLSILITLESSFLSALGLAYKESFIRKMYSVHEIVVSELVSVRLFLSQKEICS